MPSTSGSSFRTSCLYRWVMQPVTRIFCTWPARFSSAISRMLSMASSQADCRKPQVFTTTTSAPSGWAWMVWPAAWTEAIICSQFT